MVKNPPAMRESWVRSWVRKISWRREWLPTPVFLPGESHGQRSLVGYSPWGCKELDMTGSNSFFPNVRKGVSLRRSVTFLKLLSLWNHFSTEHFKGLYSKEDNVRNTV